VRPADHRHVVNGVTYHPREDFSYRRVGIASYYGGERRGVDFHGRPTANGEIYDMYGLTAAHPTLPLPSVVSVTNLENGRSLKLRVNDRGPFHDGRLIDVSRKAARELGFEDKGVARVRVEVLPEETRALKEAMLHGAR
jgi:rare lipoprotein A